MGDTKKTSHIHTHTDTKQIAHVHSNAIEMRNASRHVASRHPSDRIKYVIRRNRYALP